MWLVINSNTGEIVGIEATREKAREGKSLLQSMYEVPFSVRKG